jgi:hypothetical protein
VTANVSVSNVPAPGLYSYQFDVLYNSTLLNATATDIPTDQFLKPVTAGAFFGLDPPTIDQAAGDILAYGTLTGEELPKTGNGTLITMTFTALAAGTASLTLDNVILVGEDPTVPLVDYDTANGNVIVIPEFALVAMLAVFTVMTASAVKMKKKLK